MNKIYYILITDVWQSTSSSELYCIYDNIDTANIEYNRLCNTIDETDNCVIMYEYTLNEKDSEIKLKSNTGY